ncbi:hypothetical protein BH09DEP1_BH09DEP1_8380 [soil metagenome]
MKWLGISILLITPQCFSMHEALQVAIKQSNLKEVEKLIGLLTQVSAKDSAETHPLLKNNHVDFAQLHQLATELAPKRKAKTQTYAHAAVYQRLIAGGGTIVVGTGIFGVCLYHDIHSGEWNIQNLTSIGIASATAIVHGIKEIYLGATNKDAHNDHAKHLAITSLLLKASNQQEPATA